MQKQDHYYKPETAEYPIVRSGCMFGVTIYVIVDRTFRLPRAQDVSDALPHITYCYISVKGIDSCYEIPLGRLDTEPAGFLLESRTARVLEISVLPDHLLKRHDKRMSTRLWFHNHFSIFRRVSNCKMSTEARKPDSPSLMRRFELTRCPW